MIAVIETDSHVPPGSVATILEEAGRAWRIVKPAQGEALPAVEELKGAIILGGRMGANDEAEFPFIGELKRFIRDAAACDLPVLGICLGGQIMAEALGGKVHSNRFGEKGTNCVRLTTLGCFDPVFGGLPYDFVAFHWHNDSFVIPAGAVLLATNVCCPAQAFRYGAGIYGLQFHPEMDEATAKKWGEDEKMPEIYARYQKEGAAHEASGRAVIENFIRFAERN